MPGMEYLRRARLAKGESDGARCRGLRGPRRSAPAAGPAPAAGHRMKGSARARRAGRAEARTVRIALAGILAWARAPARSRWVGCAGLIASCAELLAPIAAADGSS